MAPPRLASFAGSIQVLQGTLVQPCTLSFAHEAHARLSSIFDELSTIRQSQGAPAAVETTSGGTSESRTTRTLPRLPDEVWEAIKGELRRAEYEALLDEAIAPIRDCRWCRERDDRPAEDEMRWSAWLGFAMHLAEDWDAVQESGYFCQVCGEFVEELQRGAATTDYEALFNPYDLHAKKPFILDAVSPSTFLALTHTLPTPRVRLDLLPDPLHPLPVTSLLQLDPSSLPSPSERELANYGRFFREWPMVEVVRDPQYVARGLAPPPWRPRLTIWHEAEPEQEEED
ncbi:hypothetical protein JCM8547_002274 [Rhodosporidiobolus lusitaniae]